MLKIDIHTHILPPELPDFKSRFGYGGFIQLRPLPPDEMEMVEDSGSVFRRVQANCFNPSRRLSGPGVQVLSTVPVLFSYWAKPQDGLELSRFLNDHLASVLVAHPQKYLGLGTVPLQDPKLAVQEAERCMKMPGMRGFQIGSHVNDWNLSARELTPFFEACESLGASLFVHPWDMMGAVKMPKYFLPWLVGMPAETSLAIASLIFGGVFERFPKLRFAFAHGGGSFPFTLGRMQHGFESRPDLCAVDCQKGPKDFIGKFYVDSLVHDRKALDFLIETMGVEKVCLGSDYPFPLGETVPGELAATLPLEQQEWIYEKAPLAWLGLARNYFNH